MWFAVQRWRSSSCSSTDHGDVPPKFTLVSTLVRAFTHRVRCTMGWIRSVLGAAEMEADIVASGGRIELPQETGTERL